MHQDRAKAAATHDISHMMSSAFDKLTRTPRTEDDSPRSSREALRIGGVGAPAAASGAGPDGPLVGMCPAAAGASEGTSAARSRRGKRRGGKRAIKERQEDIAELLSAQAPADASVLLAEPTQCSGSSQVMVETQCCDSDSDDWDQCNDPCGNSDEEKVDDSDDWRNNIGMDSEVPNYIPKVLCCSNRS